MIKNIVYQTNVKINNIQSFTTNNDESDQTYLEYLGFSDINANYTQFHQFIVVGSAVSTMNFHNAFTFIKSINSSLSKIYDAIILFDTGLRSSHINQLKKNCNKMNYCEIRNFEFDKFPNHISHLVTKSYKPLALQMLMKEFETVIWIDLSESQFLPLIGFSDQWSYNIKNRSQSSVQGWSIMWPTSSVTHPDMFKFFKVDSEQFYFHRMMSTKYFAIHRTDFVKKKIMLPWIRCILSYECIEPVGSQSTGCNFNREPHFLYSGCHWYEMSAFNLVLGLAYNMNTSRYLVHSPSVLEIPGMKNISETPQSYLSYAF